MQTSFVAARSILTRTTGFLRTVTSHSLQPYRGCPFGKSLCGVACYVQHNGHVTRGQEWGTFLDVRTNAAEVYSASFTRERNWARKNRGAFSIFLSSSTEPFPPQEARFGITRQVLQAMRHQPPDGLIVQTHSAHITRSLDVLIPLAKLCDLRCHISIESDRDTLPGLPRPAASVAARFEAAHKLKAAGLRVVITVSPLLPIADPHAFFARVAAAADAVVLDHFVGGDGSSQGTRTHRTKLPPAMSAVDPSSVHLDYRTRMGAIAEHHLPGRVGYHIDGFAGRLHATPGSCRVG